MEPGPISTDATASLPSRDRARAWFGDLVPDLSERAEEFTTDLHVLDEELIELFIAELRRAVEGIRAGAGAADETAVREHAHTLQGMGGAVGAPEVSVLGEEFSLAARGGDFPRCGRLLDALVGWHHEWQPPEVAEKTEETGSMPELEGRILVVDDEYPNRKFLNKLLRECGAEVLLAENGTEALEVIRSQRPDVALVDVMMPGIEGYEVCERVTRDPDLNQTSVIMVTARSTAQDVEYAFEKGAFDYIRKPFHSRELVARVRNALLLKRNTDAIKSWNAKMSRELEMAGSLQSRLFDPTPMFGQTLDFQAAYRPSQHIGGDMFDVQELPGGDLIAYVADVAGHGVASALISTLLKGLVNEILQSPGQPGLQDIANQLHARFRQCVQDPELYATMMLVRLRPAEGEVESLSLGHPAPLRTTADGEPAGDPIPERGGMPLGMFPEGLGLPYTEDDLVRFALPEGCSLYLYTDGLIEARNAEGADCGVDGLRRAIAHSRGPGDDWRDPNRVLETLESRGFAIGADDCSLLCFHRLDSGTLVDQGAVTPTLEAVAGLAEQLAGRMKGEPGWNGDAALLARLLITEHCVNIVKHGRVPEFQSISYRLTRGADGRLMLLIRDPGRPWDRGQWSRDRERLDARFLDHGRGLDLIDRIAPLQQHYRRDRLNNSLYLLQPDHLTRLHTHS